MKPKGIYFRLGALSAGGKFSLFTVKGYIAFI